MLFQPAILALLLASAVGTAFLLRIAPFGIAVIRSWDINSGSERQLALERRTYLVSTVLSFVFGTQMLALLLFVWNADSMAAMFAGAMCGVGTLNVNRYGFTALLLQLALFFAAGLWLAINHLDVQSPVYPIVRAKYALLLGITPLFAASSAVELLYFVSLRADVITSCCGRLFSRGASGIPGDLAALPPIPAMVVFYGLIGLAIAASTWTWQTGRGGYLTAGASFAGLVAAIAGMLSFLSLYIYEHPHHHCPFCILKSEYGYRGYLLYIPLFAGAGSGLAAGAMQPFTRLASLAVAGPRSMRKLAGFAACCFTFFVLAASWMVVRSNLILVER